MKDLLLVLSGLVSVICVLPYCRDILRGTTKPNLVSWMTWTLLTGIATSAEISAGEYRAAIFTASATFATGLVVVLGIRHGYVKYARFDIVCQIGAIVGIILWQIFNAPLVAVLGSILIDTLAGLPTVRHAWMKPYEETWQTFAIALISSSLGIAAIENYNLTNVSYAVYLLVANVTLVTVILYRRKVKTAAA